MQLEQVAERLGLARRVAGEEPAGHPILVVDGAGEVRDGVPAARRDVAVLGDVRLEVVDLGQERLGRTLPREPLGEQARGLPAKLGKWMDLEARHRPTTIPLTHAEDA